MLKFKSAAISILIALAAGIGSALLTRNSMAQYESVLKPAASPPTAVFPIVWTVLFILMGISAALIYERGGEKLPSALTLYGVQLAMNFIWPLLFFGAGLYLASFVWLVLLFAAVVIMSVRFYGILPVAGLLQIPYILWLLFAGYLNFSVWYLNR